MSALDIPSALSLVNTEPTKFPSDHSFFGSSSSQDTFITNKVVTKISSIAVDFACPPRWFCIMPEGKWMMVIVIFFYSLQFDKTAETDPIGIYLHNF